MDPGKLFYTITIARLMLFNVITFALVAGTLGPGAGHARDAQEPAMHQTSNANGIAGLPYARGRTFQNLDEYLVYLETTNGTIDLPYWRRLGPDVFQWTVRPGMARPRLLGLPS